MTITIETFINQLEKKIPLSLSMPSDKNGLKIGDPRAPLHKIIGTLELTEEVVSFAIDEGINLICLHHDPLYIPLTYIQSNNAHANLIMKLIRHNIAVYVAHTNLDAVSGGLNDFMYESLLGEHQQILDEKTSIGRYGPLKKQMILQDYLLTVIRPKQNTARIITNDMKKMISTIAVVSGSGESFYALAKQKNVDLLITGDLTYHMAMLAKEDDFSILDIGHDYEKIVENLWNSLFSAIKTENNYNFSIYNKAFNFDPWKNV